MYAWQCACLTEWSRWMYAWQCAYLTERDGRRGHVQHEAVPAYPWGSHRYGTRPQTRLGERKATVSHSGR